MDYYDSIKKFGLFMESVLVEGFGEGYPFTKSKEYPYAVTYEFKNKGGDLIEVSFLRKNFSMDDKEKWQGIWDQKGKNDRPIEISFAPKSQIKTFIKNPVKSLLGKYRLKTGSGDALKVLSTVGNIFREFYTELKEKNSDADMGKSLYVIVQPTTTKRKRLYERLFNHVVKDFPELSKDNIGIDTAAISDPLRF